MKEKRTKKESNKEEAKKEGTEVLEFAPKKTTSPSEDLKINWEAFIRFFNATLHRSTQPAQHHDTHGEHRTLCVHRPSFFSCHYFVTLINL